MEVGVRVSPGGGYLGSLCSSSSHYLSAPSTPFSSLSAPTSPSSHHPFTFFRLPDDQLPIGSPSAVPFLWEEKPGIPKSPNSPNSLNSPDFQFHFSRHFFSKASLSADELFHAGKIKPLKPPPGSFQSHLSSPRSPHNARLSPRKTKSGIDIKIYDDPFEAALMKETLSGHSANYELGDLSNKNRGRRTEKFPSIISSNFARKPTRSLSPFRTPSETALHGDDGNSLAPAKAKSSSFLSAISFPKSTRKWRLRDLLFRSASEGRVTDKAGKLRSTYTAMSEKMDDDVKTSSFRSADDGGSRMQFPEANRAVSEDLMKKKSLLTSKPGFLSRCLRFNRSGMQEISKVLDR